MIILKNVEKSKHSYSIDWIDKNVGLEFDKYCHGDVGKNNNLMIYRIYVETIFETRVYISLLDISFENLFIKMLDFS